MRKYRPSRQSREGGFKLYRNQTSLELSDEFRIGFSREFPYHRLYPTHTTVLDVVQRRETREPLAASKQIGKLSIYDVVERVLDASPPRAMKTVEFEPVRLQFAAAQNGKKIQLMLGDPHGYIAEERQSYMDMLQEVTDVPIEVPPVAPSIELGRVRKSAELSTDALQVIAERLPKYVRLLPVTAHPHPSYRDRHTALCQTRF